jgi:outer membrane autotransporter protein
MLQVRIEAQTANRHASRTKLLLGGASVAALLVAAPVAIVPTVESETGASKGWTVSLTKAVAQTTITGATNNSTITGATDPVANIATNATLTTGGSVTANGTNVALELNTLNALNVTIDNGYNITAANAVAINVTSTNTTLSINSTIRNNGTSAATINVSGNQSAATGCLTLLTSANVTNQNGSGANAIQLTPAAAGQAYTINTNGTITGNIAMTTTNLTMNVKGGTITGNITTTNATNTVGVVNFSGSNASSGATFNGSIANTSNRLLHVNVTNGTHNVTGGIWAGNASVNGTLTIGGASGITTDLTIGQNGSLSLGGNLTTGNIAGGSAGNGSISANSTLTIVATDLGLTNRLGTISIGSNGSVTLQGTNVTATALNVAANGTITRNFTAAGTYDVNTTSLSSGATFIVTGSAGTLTGNIAGSGSNGELRIASGNTTTIGATSAVGINSSTGIGTVNVSNGTLNTLANNANITAVRIIVGNGSTLAANGTGTMNATTLNVSGTANISNATLSSGINFQNITGGAMTVNVNGSSNASLAAVATNVTGVGTLNISTSGTVTATSIGSSSAALANFNVAAGTTNVSGVINATNINISGGTINANGAVTAATTFSANGTLNLTANHTGNITATDDRGTLCITGSNVTTSGPIGTAAATLATVNVTGTWRTANNLSARTVNLASGSSTYITSNMTITAATAFTTAGTLNVRGSVVTLNVAATANGFASTGCTTFVPINTTNNGTGIVANQALTLNTSHKIAVDMSQVTLASGSSLVINTTNVSTTGANFTTSNTSFLTFTRNASNITVGTVSGGYATAVSGVVSTAAPGSTGLGTALNTASSSAPAGSDVATILARIQTLSGTDLSNAIAAIQPDNTGGGATGAAASAAGTAIVVPVTSRTNSVRVANAGGEAVETGFSAGLGGRPTGVWGQAFGSWGDKNSSGGFNGYKSDTLGMAFGADSQITDSFLLGLFGGIADSDVDPKNNTTGSNTAIKTYSFGVYSNYNINPQLYVEGLALFNRHNYKSKRSAAAAGGGDVRGEWDGNQWTARGAVGYVIPTASGWTVTPNGFLQYTTLRQDDYSETGSGALRVSQKNVNTTTAGVGARFNGTYTMGGGWSLVPEVRLGLQQDFGTSKPSSTNAFVTVPGATWTTEGKELSKTAGTYGVGATFRANTGLDLSANYDGEKRSSFISHTVLARVRQTF